jgi:hypothetical protein
MALFELFTTTDYTFLELEQGAGGNKIVSETDTEGIVKLRDGMVQSDNMEQRQATSSIHVRPTESFIADVSGNMVGHGIRVSKNGLEAEYRIESQTEGFDFHTGELEFYRITLDRESIWQSNLPLE